MEAIDAVYVPYANHGYGAVEIKGIGRRAMMTAMFVSSLLIISAGLTLRIFAAEENRATDVTGEKRGWSDGIEVRWDPPIYEPRGSGSTRAKRLTETKISEAIPVPVLDADPSATIAGQGPVVDDAEPSAEGFGKGSRASGEGSESVHGSGDPPPPPFRAVEKHPQIVVRVDPVYPPAAIRTGLTGTVFVKMWVDRQGKVRRAYVEKSDHVLLDTAAVEAAKKWVFTPAIMNRGPVSVWVTIPFRFTLSDR